MINTQRGFPLFPSYEPLNGVLMTSNQYRKALAEINLTQVGFSRLIGIGERTAQSYALDETPVPNPVAILLRLMMHGIITEEDIVRVT
jgi:hypothetical protein